MVSESEPRKPASPKEAWRRGWELKLRSLRSIDPDEVQQFSEALKETANSGGAEGSLGRSQEGREILELLQNARDAIRSAGTRGDVYIGIADDGVLVANTGDPFEIRRQDVRDGLTMIDQSPKKDEDVGEMGVGLNAMHSIGEAFEVWTRLDEGSNETTRLRLSPAFLIGAISNILGEGDRFDAVCSTIADPVLKGNLLESGDGSLAAADIDERTQRFLSNLPLFFYPVPLETAADARDSPLAERAHALLSDGDEPFLESEHGTLGQFRTAVFVEFKDDDWWTFLSNLVEEEHLPNRDERDGATKAAMIWESLRYTSEGTSALGPETLLHLDWIDRLFLERIGSDTTERQIWTMDRVAEETVDGGDEPGASGRQTVVGNDRVTIHSNDSTTSTTRYYDHFAREEGSPRMLVPRPDHQADSSSRIPEPSRNGYKPSLYYPIDGAPLSFPFSMHGSFQVDPTRKNFANAPDENADALREVAALVGDVARIGGEESIGDVTLGDIYPWILLPPVPSELESGGSRGEYTPLYEFAFECYATLQVAPSVRLDAGDSETGSPADVLLHWDVEVASAFRSLQGIVDDIPGSRLPTPEVLAAFLSIAEEWPERVQVLLGFEEATRVAQFSDLDSDALETRDEAVLERWIEHLTASLAMETKEARRADAKSLFSGTLQLAAKYREEADLDHSRIAKRLGDDLEGIAILPTLYRDRGSDRPSEDRSLLVALEQHGQEEGSTNYDRLSRKVRWGIENTEDRPLTPPHDSKFSVYFLDPDAVPPVGINILENAGQRWGIGKFENRPDFIRDLLDAVIANGTLSVRDLNVLLREYSRIGSGADDLGADEGAFHELTGLNKGVSHDDHRRRQAKRRISLRRIALDFDGERLPVAETCFDHEWYPYHSDASEEVPTPPEIAPSKPLPPPESVPWATVRGEDVEAPDIAAILGLLGVSSLPGIEIPWQRADDHPDPDDVAHWNPTQWSDTQKGALESKLPEALETEYAGYLAYVSGPGYGPAETASHSQKCPVKDSLNQDLGSFDVSLVSWPWLPDLDELRELGVEAIEWTLTEWSGAFGNSILYTGWDCDNYPHSHAGWDQPVPSLFNWQLRHLTWWTGIDEPTFWDDAHLGVAVLRDRSPLDEYLPTITVADAGLDESMLAAFDVVRADDLPPTDAAYRLQELLVQLAGDSQGALPPDELSPVHLPGSPGGWRTAYRKLIEPIATFLGDHDAADLTDIPFLTHVPVRRGDDWYVAPIEWLRSEARDRLYFYPNDRKRWHRRKYEEKSATEGWLLLPTPQPWIRGFGAYAEGLGGERIDARPPTYSELPGEPISGGGLIETYRDHLAERADFIIAALDQVTDENVEKQKEKLQTAIDGMVATRRLEGQVPDEAGASVYETGGEWVFVLDSTVLSPEDVDARALAWATALLFEQPSQLDSITLAVDPEMDAEQLRSLWEEQLEVVEGHWDVERSTRQLLDAISTFTAADLEFDVRVIVDELADAEWTRGEVRDHLMGDEGEPVSPFATARRSIREAVPDELAPILRRFITTWADHDADRSTWTALLQEADLDTTAEEAVIAWLEANQQLLRHRLVPTSVEDWADRLDAVGKALRDGDSFEGVGEWRDAIEARAQRSRVGWADRFSVELHRPVEGDRWFWYGDVERIRAEVLAPVVEFVETEYAYGTDLGGLITHYVETGELLSRQGRSSKDRQRMAGRMIANLVSTDAGALDDIERATLDVHTGSAATPGSGGGGDRASYSYTERGELAEVAVLGNVLSTVERWLETHDIQTFRRDFERLEADQDAHEYKWHLISDWEDELPSCLDQLDASAVSNWREEIHRVADEERPQPALRLLNVTQESGPGYDILDPLGNDDANPALAAFDHLRPIPVEVKAVEGQPPYRFQLTTNELRQARAFIEAGVGYELRLVTIPADRQLTAGSISTIAHRLDSSAKLRDLLRPTEEEHGLTTPELGFEQLVKGGYVNVELDVGELQSS